MVLIELASENLVTTILVAVLIVGLIGETLGLYIFFPKHLKGKPGAEEKNSLQVVEEYANKSLTFAGLTFAGLTFFIAQFYPAHRDEIIAPMILFTIGFFFFLVAFKMEFFASVRRIWILTLQKVFNYGILFVVTGTLVILGRTVSELLPFVVGGAIVIFGLHFYELWLDIKDYRKEAKNQPDS